MDEIQVMCIGKQSNCVSSWMIGQDFFLYLKHVELKDGKLKCKMFSRLQYKAIPSCRETHRHQIEYGIKVYLPVE